MKRFRTNRNSRISEALIRAVTYADVVARDDRLRADLRSAISHGQASGVRELFTDARTSQLPMRLVWDKDLRDAVRALLDDLDHAASRARHKSHLRVRQTLMITGAAGLLAAATPRVRRWATGVGWAGHGHGAKQHAPSGERASVGATV